MRGRVEKVIGDGVRGMWIGTFHGIAHRLLRAHPSGCGAAAGFPRSSTPTTSTASFAGCSRRSIWTKHWAPRAVMGYINGRRTRGCAPATSISTATPSPAPISRSTRPIRDLRSLRAGGLRRAPVAAAHELWLNKPHILEHYRDRFQNILVDEFQDTNGIQYAWLRMLAGDTGKVMIVGDDDQSIYGWRGAKIENIQRFLTDYRGRRPSAWSRTTAPPPTSSKPPTASSPTTPGAARQELWTEGGRGRAGDFAVRRLQQRGGRGPLRGRPPQDWKRRGSARRLRHPLSFQRPVAGAGRGADAGRHALSHLWRPALLRAPEIKDAMAYLRLINNRGDDASFERVVNTPTRGIGDRTLGSCVSTPAIRARTCGNRPRHCSMTRC